MAANRYTHIANDMRLRITAHQWPAGTQLPIEDVLAAEFNVGRMTIRKALRILEAERLIIARHGRGRFVLGPDGQTGPMPTTKRGQVEEHLRALVAASPPGTPLPMIDALMELFDASPPTVRAAQVKLSAEGLIRRGPKRSYRTL